MSYAPRSPPPRENGKSSHRKLRASPRTNQTVEDRIRSSKNSRSIASNNYFFEEDHETLLEEKRILIMEINNLRDEVLQLREEVLLKDDAAILSEASNEALRRRFELFTREPDYEDIKRCVSTSLTRLQTEYDEIENQWRILISNFSKFNKTKLLDEIQDQYDLMACLKRDNFFILSQYQDVCSQIHSPELSTASSIYQKHIIQIDKLHEKLEQEQQEELNLHETIEKLRKNSILSIKRQMKLDKMKKRYTKVFHYRKVRENEIEMVKKKHAEQIQFMLMIKKKNDKERNERNERKKFSEAMQDKPKRYQSRPTNHIKAENIEYAISLNKNPRRTKPSSKNSQNVVYSRSQSVVKSDKSDKSVKSKKSKKTQKPQSSLKTENIPIPDASSQSKSNLNSTKSSMHIEDQESIQRKINSALKSTSSSSPPDKETDEPLSNIQSEIGNKLTSKTDSETKPSNETENQSKESESGVKDKIQASKSDSQSEIKKISGSQTEKSENLGLSDEFDSSGKEQSSKESNAGADKETPSSKETENEKESSAEASTETQSEKEKESDKESQSEKEKESDKEAQSEKEKESDKEAQSEKESDKEAQSEKEKENDKETQSEKEKESEKEPQSEKESEKETKSERESISEKEKEEESSSAVEKEAKSEDRKESGSEAGEEEQPSKEKESSDQSEKGEKSEKESQSADSSHSSESGNNSDEKSEEDKKESDFGDFEPSSSPKKDDDEYDGNLFQGGTSQKPSQIQEPDSNNDNKSGSETDSDF